MNKFYSIIYASDKEELERKKQEELDLGNACVRVMLPCDCIMKHPHKPGYKIWEVGNDNSIPDRAYLICANCAEGIPYVDEAYKLSLETPVKKKKNDK